MNPVLLFTLYMCKYTFAVLEYLQFELTDLFVLPKSSTVTEVSPLCFYDPQFFGSLEKKMDIFHIYAVSPDEWITQFTKQACRDETLVIQFAFLHTRIVDKYCTDVPHCIQIMMIKIYTKFASTELTIAIREDDGSK